MRYRDYPRGNGKEDDSDEAFVLKMFNYARRICRRAGFPVWDNHIDGCEYESDIGLAVVKALRVWREDGGMSKASFCTKCALRACWFRLQKREIEEKNHQQQLIFTKEEGERGWHVLPIEGMVVDTDMRGEGEEPILSDEDFELLSFVAAHGQKEAVKLLKSQGVAVDGIQLRELLDAIALRVQGKVLERAVRPNRYIDTKQAGREVTSAPRESSD